MKIIKYALVLTSIILTTLTYSAIPNTNDSTTFLGPNFKANVTNNISDLTAYSLAGEAGFRNYRMGGTLAWNVSDYQRVKVSGEYLWQKITYSFFDGNTDQWVQQGALGADYQYDFGGNSDLMPQLNLNAYFSHAPSKNIGTDIATYTTSGVTQAFTVIKRIAGSNAEGISPGVTIQPWRGTRTGLDVNYDNVRYSTQYIPTQNTHGLGGTFHVQQALADNVELDLSAAVRQPFNNYQAGVYWTHIPYYGTWTFGVDSAYTVGKNTLPDTYNISLSASYFIDQLPEKASPTSFYSDSFLGWTAKPAVYMPQVLAIPDQKVTLCSPISSAIPNPLTELTSNFTINAAQYFSGTGITYSLKLASTPAAGSIVINPTTGVITGSGLGLGYTDNITITATNSCGSASLTTLLNVVA